MATTPKKQPVRFSFGAAIVCVVGFAALASWPYLTRAAERASQGKPVSVADVRQDVDASMKQRMKKMEKDKPFEPKSVLAQPNGTLLIGGKAGLQELRDGQVFPVESFGGMDVRGLTAKDGIVWAAAKDGLWKKEGAEWRNIKKGDFWALTFERDGSMLLAGKMGILRSKDGSAWDMVAGTETGSKPDHD